MVTRTSFISVIEETKNLSLSDEKKRSPIHSPVKQVITDRQTYGQVDRHIYKKQTDGQIEGQTDGQTDRQTDR